MKTDVQTQLKDYWQGVYDAAPEIVEADVREPRAISVVPTEKNTRLRPVWVAGLAAALVLVVIGGVGLITVTGDEELAPAAPTVDAALLGGSWERTVIDPDGVGPQLHFEDLQATSYGLVAAAVMDGIWMSTDGTDWHQALAVPYEASNLPVETPTPPLTVPPPAGLVESYVRLVAEYDGVLYAVGTMATGINTPEMESRLVVWRSEDGRQWQDITLEEVMGGFAPGPSVIMVAEDALLVFTEDGAVHRSENGKTWTRFSPDHTGLTSAPTAIAWFGGEYVAVGRLDISSVFTSRDGTTWTEVPASEFPEGHYPNGPLVEFDGNLYLGGLTFLDDAAGAVWRSPDGRTWSLVDLGIRAPYGSSSDDEELPAMYAVANLIVTPDGMLVIGWRSGEAVNQGEIVLLATADGIDYKPVIDSAELFALAFETAGTLFEGRIVMVGNSYPSSEAELAYQWVWTP